MQQGTHDGGQVRGVLGLLRNGGGRGVVRRRGSKAKQSRGQGKGQEKEGLGLGWWV